MKGNDVILDKEKYIKIFSFICQGAEQCFCSPCFYDRWLFA